MMRQKRVNLKLLQHQQVRTPDPMTGAVTVVSRARVILATIILVDGEVISIQLAAGVKDTTLSSMDSSEATNFHYLYLF